ncbi:MAG: hypothetical protein CVU53_06560, partial [Deltaproteobacteria bacterium HGW-Deltaproteobacteria-11]
ELVDAEGDLFFDRKDIEFLIRFGELTPENDARVQKEGKETDKYFYRTPASIRVRADLIDEKLANIRLCDPAVGSGAFLVGMMTEIAKVRQTLSTYIDGQGPRSPYLFKRQAIQNSLYGVDIDPGAVEIAKLRLWLSLIVDEDDIREIKPLPNLDYKVMQGNSLLEEFEGVKLFDEKLITDTPMDEIAVLIRGVKRKQTLLQREYFRLKEAGLLTPVKRQDMELQLQEQATLLKRIEKRAGKIGEEIPLFDSEAKQKADELKQLHKDFFESFQKSRKDTIKARIEAMEWELIEATLKEQHKTNALKRIGEGKRANIRPFFLWKFHFAEVFREKSGFDVVIANPPYVRQEAIRPLKPDLAKAFGKFYCGTADLYTYFYKCGLDLLKVGGHLCFIAPNKFMRAGYGRNTRALLAGEATPKVVIDFGDLPIFDATTYPSILLVEKGKPEAAGKTLAATFTDPAQLERLDEALAAVGFTMPIDALKAEGWTLERPETLALMEKLRKAGKPLGEYVEGKFYYGIKTGLNEAFVIDDATREQLIAEDPKSADLIKPWLRGRDIRKWTAQWAGLYLITIASSTNREWPWSKEKSEAKARLLFAKAYPAIYRHLSQYEKKLRIRDDQGKFWWELRSCVYWEEFERTKLVYQEIATFQSFGYAEEGLVCNNKCFLIPEKNDFLLGLLNSQLTWWFLGNLTSGLVGGARAMQMPYIEQLPIPPPADAQKTPI